MPQLIVENFRHGLDTRRSVLTSELGVLATLLNAHVNQGGEIEKRKAFVGIDMSTGKPVGVNILGVESLRDSIVIFGGETNTSGTWPASLSVSPAFTYQKLSRIPAATAAVGVCNTTATPNFCTYCAGFSNEVKATSIIYSTVYGGKAFVLAGMADGTYCAFYDAVAVNDINLMGQVLPDMNNRLKMFCMLARGVNNTDSYTADLNASIGGADPAGITITADDPNRAFTLALSGTGTVGAGLPVESLLSDATPSIPGKIASGYFQIQDGYKDGTNNRITGVTIGGTQLLGADVNYQEDAISTAVAVALNITTNSVNFRAQAFGNTVVIYTRVEGATQNNKIIVVTVVGKVMIGSLAIAFFGTRFTLDYIQIDGISLVTPILYPTIGETLTGFATRVAATINTGSGTHGYTSLSRNNVVKISKLVTSSEDAVTGDSSPRSRGLIPVLVQITPTTTDDKGYALEADNSVLQALVDTSVINMYYFVDPIYAFNFDRPIPATDGRTYVPIVALPIAGVPPYQFVWRIGTQINMDIVFDDTYGVSTFIRDKRPITGLGDVSTKSGTIILDVIDANGLKASSVIIPIRCLVQFAR